jgi:hypothetical protein
MGQTKSRINQVSFGKSRLTRAALPFSESGVQRALGHSLPYQILDLRPGTVQVWSAQGGLPAQSRRWRRRAWTTLPSAVCALVPTPAGLQYADQKVANREIRVGRGATETGP